MLNTALDIARSGLAAEGVRLQTAANNIANVSTKDYVPQQVEQVALASPGGVQAKIRPAMPPYFPAAATVVDLAREMTTLIEAEAAYKANLAVIQTVDEMTDSLLDIFDNKERR
ncbi:MAG: flagellar basal body rod protein FlgC [Hyphomicrobiaceae bacterium]